MRVPDTLLQTNFMRNVSKNRSKLAEIQFQLTTQSKVNKPSDNPLSNSRIMRLQNQLSSINTYKTNITYGQSMIDDSILSMESIQDNVQNAIIELTKLNSGTVSADELETFAQSIDGTLEILVDLANTSFNGQYNFGGTETNTKPFTYDKANNRVVSNSNSIGGDRVVNISSTIAQKFNISGKNLFQSVLTQNGNLDSSAGIGTAQTTSSTIYDAEGKEYTLNQTFTATAANTYELNYEIVDSDSNVISSDTVSDIKFNAESGEFESINGEAFGEIKIQNSANKIDVVLDIKSLKEEAKPAILNDSLNQKADIFNTLIAIKEKLSAGEKPTAEQYKMVTDFNQHVLNSLSEAGGIANKLTATHDVLISREIEVATLLSAEKDVDVAKALMDLESTQYALDVGYRISSMILPKSLLDYL
ncbi:MAG: flagellar hook-associated protein FlgL [Ignavibacteriae bacterium]|nr:flagellar hook-associated protein FlgL [Ignavibacteriota bacterium]